MKTVHTWLKEYSESHQNKTNITIHMICVPAIFLSIIGLLYCVHILDTGNTVITLAHVAAAFAIIYYLRLSIKLGAALTIFTIICLRFWGFVEKNEGPVFIIAISIFAAAWIGQFIGHKIEGKKPSFLQDLRFLLIGPLWTISHIIKP
ncbi:MAG: Mpo1-like protein [Bacteroidota bacterium]